ncbi:hypothetical protein [Nocardioides sp. Iso805N]|uniref:hypothetical protein n=1 Tax=Nocardioides sp. Iso805N TaxID=1283287 RepID=UPI00036547B4|nr:hypothetical protein [Nocardioides sp. Iso805N]
MNDLVDDTYWLGRATEMVEGALDQRKATADKLTSTAAWLATLTTAGVTSLVALRNPELGTPIVVLLALDLAVVIAAYVAGLLASQPRFRSFDPRVPDEIRQAHESAVLSVRRSLVTATALVITAAVLSSLVLVFVASAPRAG